MGRCPPDLHQSARPSGDPYTVAEAFNDMEEYGRLGTFDAALRDIDSKASAAHQEAQEVNDKINRVEGVNTSAATPAPERR